MLVYNSPEHAKQRQDVKPPDDILIRVMIKTLNDYIPEGATSTKGILQQLIWDYENLQHMREYSQKWVDVNVALPEPKTLVIALYEDKLIETNFIDKSKWYENYKNNKVTHWMPLPELPKTK